MYYDIVDSPVGSLTVSADGTHITGLHIAGDRYFTTIPTGWVADATHPLLRQARRELGEYFTGKRQRFDLPLAPTGTPFQQEVWGILADVDPGATTSYGEIARALGRPLAARAVGTAVGRNPICLFIPCHRVLASGGGFGGYVAGVDCKRQLLALEGITLAS